MNPKVKKKWLKALRSGEYRQGRDRLITEPGRGRNVSDDYEFCCLGVVQNLYCLEKNETFLEDKFWHPVLSQDAEEWAGLRYSVQGNLANLNDVNGWSFKRIANWAEKNL